jgi:deazaflavin-dependent oxidoreductase (nitroreductase family)
VGREDARPRGASRHRDRPRIAEDAAVDEPDAIGDEMVAWGRAARIESRGRRSGLVRRAVVGFVESGDGSVLVAAGSASTAWALNPLADPSCLVTIADRSFPAVAEPLDGAEHAAAIRDLILRGGTPAEGLGHGPSFRLRPASAARPARDAS